MADIHIHREHALGLEKARELARSWAGKLEDKFEMQCTVQQGPSGDTVEFSRWGVQGSLAVAADHFELRARLGPLLGALKATIEGQIEKELDALLAGGGKKKA